MKTIILSDVCFDELSSAMHDAAAPSGTWAPPTEPTKPAVEALATPAGYPAGDALLTVMAAIFNAFPLEKIAWDGYRLCGCPTDTNEPCNKWNGFKNDTEEPHPFVTAARWRKAGMPPGQIITALASENRAVTVDQIAQLEMVMKHYSLM